MKDWRGFFLPKNLDHSVMIDRKQLLQLLNRKVELDEEIQDLSKEQQVKKQLTNKKKKERIEHQKMLEAAERDYDERRMLRFGNLVDLDGLEVSGPSQIVLDL